MIRLGRVRRRQHRRTHREQKIRAPHRLHNDQPDSEALRRWEMPPGFPRAEGAEAMAQNGPFHLQRAQLQGHEC